MTLNGHAKSPDRTDVMKRQSVPTTLCVAHALRTAPPKNHVGTSQCNISEPRTRSKWSGSGPADLFHGDRICFESASARCVKLSRSLRQNSRDCFGIHAAPFYNCLGHSLHGVSFTLLSIGLGGCCWIAEIRVATSGIGVRQSSCVSELNICIDTFVSITQQYGSEQSVASPLIWVWHFHHSADALCIIRDCGLQHRSDTAINNHRLPVTRDPVRPGAQSKQCWSSAPVQTLCRRPWRNTCHMRSPSPGPCLQTELSAALKYLLLDLKSGGMLPRASTELSTPPCPATRNVHSAHTGSTINTHSQGNAL